jgi:hypothetical protein
VEETFTIIVELGGMGDTMFENCCMKVEEGRKEEKWRKEVFIVVALDQDNVILDIDLSCLIRSGRMVREISQEHW